MRGSASTTSASPSAPARIEEVREILVKMRADLWDDVKAGRIKVPIDKTYPLAEAKAGHEHMRTNQHFGKILLIP